MEHADLFVRVYKGPRSSISHYVNNSSGMLTNWALCGTFPHWFIGWLGTGTQNEIDHAIKLPLCAKCETAYKP